MSTQDLIRIGIVVGVGLVMCLLGSRVVTVVFRLADRPERRQPTDSPAQQPVAPRRLEAAGSRLRGGAWIGMLERVAIYASILTGFGEGIAIVLAVKSLARYPELSARDSAGAAERFIIGTFVSTLVAAGSAGLALWLLGLL